MECGTISQRTKVMKGAHIHPMGVVRLLRNGKASSKPSFVSMTNIKNYRLMAKPKHQSNNLRFFDCRFG